MQSAVRQVSTRTISITSFDERASYRLKLLRHFPATSRAGGTPLSGIETAGGEGIASWPEETQGCGLKQRDPQPRAARLPPSEARAPSQAGPDLKGPSLPLLPLPSFAQPEQYQSK